MHRLGIWSPYQKGPMQDFSVRQAELYQAFTQKFEANGGAGTTIYFHSYDKDRGMDKYITSETDPGTGVSFTARVFKDGEQVQGRAEEREDAR